MDPVTVALAWAIAGTSHSHDPHQAAPTSVIRAADMGSASTYWAAEIAEAARRFGLPGYWIGAVIDAESGGRVDAVSPKGAIGLMQLMPQTWTELRARLGLGSDPFDPHDNILAGAAYLRAMLDRYGVPDFLVAYNAGPERLETARSTGEKLPEETREFVQNVLRKVRFGVEFEAYPTRNSASDSTGDGLFARENSEGNQPSWRRILVPVQQNSAAALNSNQSK